MQLRTYQRAAIEASLDALRRGIKRPIACLPTGSGKSPTICTMVAELAQRYPDKRFLITTHTQELIGQLADTYERVSGIKPGVYAAGLGRREMGAQVTVGQIQSIFRRIQDFGPQKLIVIDEAHSVPAEGNGQYRKMLEMAAVVNPDVAVCGWTATPYRLGHGLCFGKGSPFDELVFDALIKDLIRDGFLSPLVSKDGGRPNLTSVHVRQGEYVASELESVMTDEALVRKAVKEIMHYGHDRKAWLLFASGVKHARMISEAIQSHGVECPVITGDTPDGERKQLIARYKNQDLRCMANVGVLTTGFDATHIDLIGLLRPTKSPGLYYQCVGRGLRIHPGKENTMVLDLAGCIAEHGPIDTLNDRIQKAKSAKGKGDAPTKTCDQCKEIVPAGVRKCPACGFAFPEIRIAKHGARADNASPLSTNKPTTLTVKSVNYVVHVGKDASKPATLRVNYRCGMHQVTEFVSVDVNSHPYARGKALLWLADTPKQVGEDGRTLQASQGVIVGTFNGQSVELKSAIELAAFRTCLQTPTTIEATRDGQYWRVVRRSFAKEMTS